MTIIYPDEEIMLDDETKVTKEIKFDPELYIYIQKLMKEKDKPFDEIVNNMIREHAEDSLKPVKIIPYIQPTTIPTIVPWYKYGINTTTYTDQNHTAYYYKTN